MEAILSSAFLSLHGLPPRFLIFFLQCNGTMIELRGGASDNNAYWDGEVSYPGDWRTTPF